MIKRLSAVCPTLDMKEENTDQKLVAFAEIDWHEFAIVQTIEFTATDAVTELPVPMTLQQMEARALAEKRMTAMVMEDTAEEFERAKQAAEAQAAAAARVAQESSTEAEELRKKKLKEAQEMLKEQQRALDLQAKNIEGAGPMKIRTDYVPKSEYPF